MQQADYQAQGDSFLNEFGIRFKAAKSPLGGCPPWAREAKSDGYACIRCKSVHGDRFMITLAKGELGENYREVRFPFWNSLNEATSKPFARPSAYDVLACISGDVNCPSKFEDFCSEYGYDSDSIKALKTFERCRALSEKLNEFFSKAELAALSEIS